MFSDLKNFCQDVLNTARREVRMWIERPVYLVASVLIMGVSTLFYVTLMHKGAPENMPIAVVDLDGSTISRRMVHELQAASGVEVVRVCTNYAEARDMMQRGQIYALLEIPENFYADLSAQRQPQVDFYVTYAFTVGGTSAYKQLLTVTNLLNGAFLQQVLRLKGTSEYEIMNIVQPIKIDAHMLFNPWGNYAYYLLTTILPGTLGVVILMLTIFSIGIELKLSTSHAWLRAANCHYGAAMVGKMLPYTILFFLLGQGFMIILYQFLYFPSNGHLWAMMLNLFGFIVAMQCFGVVLIGLLPVLRDAISAGALLGMMSFTLSGFTFPNMGMLPFVRSIAYLFPLRHYYLTYVNEALLQAPVYESLTTMLAYVGFMIAAWAVGGRLCHAMVYLRYPKK